MANLLTSIGSAVGNVGKGFLSGAGEGAGLGQVFKPATMAMKSPVTGITSQVATPSSIWHKVGAALGERAVSGGGSTPSSPSLPSPSTETSISQSRGYQPPQKKQAELERLLRELARR